MYTSIREHLNTDTNDLSCWVDDFFKCLNKIEINKPTADMDRENKVDKVSQEATMTPDDHEVSSISSASSGQHVLKDNYVKARREREIEQEQAELEKKRLQEILDLCMEFQRQESLKTAGSAAKSAAIQTSSTSSSISSSSSSSSESIKPAKPEESLIATLPKLTSILNLKQNQAKLGMCQRSSAPTNTSNSEVRLID